MRMKSPLCRLLVGLPKFDLFVTLDASTRASIRCAATQGERTEDREVEVPSARAAELVDPRVAEADAFGLRPCGRVEVEAVRADVADLRRPSPTRSAVCRLPGVFNVVPSAVTVNGEPLNTPRMPLICQSLMRALAMLRLPFAAPGQLIDESHLEGVGPVAVGERPVAVLGFGASEPRSRFSTPSSG